MANFGLSRLSVVTPWAPSWRDARSAVGAPQLLLDATEHECLNDAVASATLVIGTGTLTYRRPEQKVIELPELAPYVLQEIERGGRASIVFGSEKHGLTREELALCHVLCVIPTADEQPSMNLGQAVAVCLYELAARPAGSSQPDVKMDKTASASDPESGNTSETHARVVAKELDVLGELVEKLMQASGYSAAAKQAANTHEIRLMLRRLHLKHEDLRRILGLLRRALWKLNRTK